MFRSALSENTLSFFSNMKRIYEIKKSANSNERKKCVKIQIRILNALLSKEKKIDNKLLKELGKHFKDEKEMKILADLKKINRTQEKILAASLFEELKKIKERIAEYKENLIAQRDADSQDVHELMNAEMNILNTLRKFLDEASKIKEKIEANINRVKKIEYKQWFRHLINGVAWINVHRQFSVIVEGLENIPEKGPVIIAPRHFHGQVDGSLFLSIIPRHTFFLRAVDWVDNSDIKLQRLIFSRAGEIPVNRPHMPKRQDKYPNGSPKSATKRVIDALILGQAVLVFPESRSNIDIRSTEEIRRDIVMDIQPGIFLFAQRAQEITGMKIPIIPVGTIYPDKDDKKIIEVNFGKPFYFPLHADKESFNEYCNKLRNKIVELSKER